MADSPSVRPLAGAPTTVTGAVLELNQRHVALLSGLDERRLMRLLGEAFHASVIGHGETFLIAFDQLARYGSANFRWFQSRYPSFVYVDRIASAEQARGMGHANRLYRDLFEAASAAGHGLIVCEVNVDPPPRCLPRRLRLPGGRPRPAGGSLRLPVSRTPRSPSSAASATASPESPLATCRSLSSPSCSVRPWAPWPRAVIRPRQNPNRGWWMPCYSADRF